MKHSIDSVLSDSEIINCYKIVFIIIVWLTSLLLKVIFNNPNYKNANVAWFSLRLY